MRCLDPWISVLELQLGGGGLYGCWPEKTAEEEVVCMMFSMLCNGVDLGFRSKEHASGTRQEGKAQDLTAQGCEGLSCSVVELPCHHGPSLKVLTENASYDSSALMASLPNSSHILSPIFTPLPTTLRIEDIHYLKKKDALSIPPRELQGKLFNSYINSVHPQIPFLDLRHFGEAISKQETEKQVSLLLFQAVMLAGCAAVDMQHLLDAGFQTRAEAQSIFFNRVKVCWLFPSHL